MSTGANNPIFELLCDIGVCSEDGVTLFHSGVRDRDDIDVLMCKRTQALFLNTVEHMSIRHYESKSTTHPYGKEKRAIITTNDDTQRRHRDFANTVRGRRWLDVGCGSGAMLDSLGPLAKVCAGVEPQLEARTFLSEMGHKVYGDITEVSDVQKWDVVTLFHVFEHLKAPVSVLKDINGLLSDDGKLIIEVPHARDALITLFCSSEFCKHTFWSEHLFLHTRETLKALVNYAGFDVTSIRGVQRYPLANHLHWLSKGKPRGHIEWHSLSGAGLDDAYFAYLARLDITDTLMLEAVKR